MKKLKILYSEIHKVKQTYADEIDLNDSVKWKSLIDKVRNRSDCDFILNLLPTEPSDKLENWLFLYHFINADEYTQKVSVQDESRNYSFFEQEWSIQDSDGLILIEDWSY
jgi:hypothetical protein